MSPNKTSPRRVTARVVLALVSAAMIMFVLFASGPTGAVSFAQQAQQTTPGNATIQFLNPSKATSTELTANTNDGDNASYHLNAWISRRPAIQTTVVFQYRQGSGPPVTIGNATPRGSDELTFDLYWPSTNVTGDAAETGFPSDGEYTLVAILFATGNEVARDEETVTVNDDPPASPVPTPPTDQDQPSSVEITSPANADVFGFYDPPGSATNAGGIQVAKSTGSNTSPANVTAYYTTSQPGTEPDFKSCGTESSTNSNDGVRCTIGSTPPSTVNAVAVVSEQTTATMTTDEDAADAHRVFGYTQDPKRVVINPPTQNTVSAPGCTAPFIATVEDQFDRYVAGANVDVHAQGPSDSLAYDVVASGETGDDTHANQAPSGHATESARNCESSNAQTGSQGWHENQSVDTKHIETTATGSADNGAFRFELYSGASGVTHFTVFADEDDNDRWCFQEASGNGSVGWEQAAPTPVGVSVDEDNCASPTPSSSTSSAPPSSAPPTSASPTSPSPTSSSPGTSSPSPSNSTSPGPTPTNTNTPPPDVREETDVTISFNRPRFTGRVKSDDGNCQSHRSVILKKVRPGRDRIVGRDSSDNQGDYSIRERRARGRYYVIAPEVAYTAGDGHTVTCQRGRSRTVRARR